MADVELWLEGLCSRDHARPTIHKPFRLGKWIVGTTGQVMGAIPDDGRETPSDVPNGETVRLQLGHEMEDPVEFDTAALLDWCGPATDPVVCAECGHEHTCSNRTGLRRTNRQGTFRGRRFNRRLLALLLKDSPGERVRIGVVGDRDHYPLLIEGDGWRGLVMPLRSLHPEPWEEDDEREIAPLEDLIATEATK